MPQVIGIETTINDVVKRAESLEGGLTERNILSALDDTRTGEVMELVTHFDVSGDRGFSESLRHVAANIYMAEENIREAKKAREQGQRIEVGNRLYFLLQEGVEVGFNFHHTTKRERFIQRSGDDIFLTRDGVPALKRFPNTMEGLMEALRELRNE